MIKKQINVIFVLLISVCANAYSMEERALSADACESCARTECPSVTCSSGGVPAGGSSRVERAHPVRSAKTSDKMSLSFVLNPECGAESRGSASVSAPASREPGIFSEFSVKPRVDRYNCGMCGFQCSTRYEYDCHLRTGDKHLMRKCKLCSCFLFPRKWATHMMEQHNQPRGGCIYGCSECSNTHWNRILSFQGHMIRHVEACTVTVQEVRSSVGLQIIGALVGSDSPSNAL